MVTDVEQVCCPEIHLLYLLQEFHHHRPLKNSSKSVFTAYIAPLGYWQLAFLHTVHAYGERTQQSDWCVFSPSHDCVSNFFPLQPFCSTLLKKKKKRPNTQLHGSIFWFSHQNLANILFGDRSSKFQSLPWVVCCPFHIIGIRCEILQDCHSLS